MNICSWILVRRWRRQQQETPGVSLASQTASRSTWILISTFFWR